MGLLSWFRDIELQAMSRIDRMLVSVDWVDHFGNVSQKVLPRVIFDHFPLVRRPTYPYTKSPPIDGVMKL